MSGELEVWIGALLTLMVYSFLYRDNPFYKLAEHIFVGVSAAYWMVAGFWSTFWPNVVERLAPASARVVNPGASPGEFEPLVLIPVALGCMLLLRLHPRTAWLARWPTAFAIGVSAGYNLVHYLRSDFLLQIHAAAAPGLIVLDGTRLDVAASLDRLLLLAGTLCGLAYFTFSRERRGATGFMAKAGVLFLMVTFGATYGYAVMGRVSLLIGRLRDLSGRWLGLL